MYFPPQGFYFSVTIIGENSSQDSGFQEVSGINLELATDTIKEGGENHLNYRVPSGAKYGTLSLKRGLVYPTSPLGKWCLGTLQGNLDEKIKTQTISVKLLDIKDRNKSVAAWTFHNAYPIKWDIGGLNAMDSAILVETMDLAFSYFEYASNGKSINKQPKRSKQSSALRSSSSPGPSGGGTVGRLAGELASGLIEGLSDPSKLKNVFASGGKLAKGAINAIGSLFS